MDAACHFVFGDVERNGAHAPLIVDGGFGQHGDKPGLAYEFQQNVDLVELDAYAEPAVAVAGQLVEKVACLQASGRQGEIKALKLAERDFFARGEFMAFGYDCRQVVLKEYV